MVYVGSDDKLTTPEVAKEVAKKRGSGLQILPGRGHCLPYETGNEDLLKDIESYISTIGKLSCRRF